MNGIQPLRFITRAVLPLVYDESLSYYEFLCKVLDKLNVVITNSNTQSEAIKALNTELKNFEASTDAKFLEYQANVEKLFDEVEAKLKLKEDTANKTQEITDNSTETQYPSAKAVLEYVKAHAGGGSADIVSFDFPHGQETVTYDTTDGITMTGQARLTDSNGETNDIAATVSIPIKAGDGVSIDATADGKAVEVKNTNPITLEYSVSTGAVNGIDGAVLQATYDANGNNIVATYATRSEVEGKVNSTTNGLKVYATDDIGNQTTVDYTPAILADSIPLRNASGNLAGNAPTTNNDYTPKNYVDTAVSGKLDKITSTSASSRVYAVRFDGAQTTYNITASIEPSVLAFRDTDGSLKVPTPTANEQATPKSYIDGLAETWTFTLEDGSILQKNVLVK